MKSLIRRKLEMAARVGEFSRAHVGTEPGLGPALARLDERLTYAQAIESRLHEGLDAVSAARTRRMELRRVAKGPIGDTLAAEFQAAAEAMRTARRDFFRAREGLEAICIDLMALVKLIGGITGYRFGNDREVMAEWRAARHIPRAPRIVDSGRTTPPSDVRPAA
jgi:hypothetical protein